MQTIVCQTAETFSPEPIQKPQSLQTQAGTQVSASDAPRKSDFLSLLNENLQKESAAAEAPKESPAQTAENVPYGQNEREEKIAENASENAAEKEPARVAKAEESKADGAETGVKKARDKGGLEEKAKKVSNDPMIQAALALGQEKKPAPKVEGGQIGQSGQKSAANLAQAKKVQKTDESASNKIDPKQLEFMRKFSQEKAAAMEKASDENAGGLKDGAELLAQTKSLLDGQKVVHDAPDFSYAFEEFVPEQKGSEPLVGNLDGVKNGKKSGQKPVIQVTDLRTKPETLAAQKPEQKDARKNFSVAVKETGKAQVQMTLDLNNQAQKNILSLDSQSAASDGSTFQAMLKNQITQNAADFVKAGNIVLRDNNQGQINLILHPEELGNVKISVEMNGKSVVGHITVQSREALEAFGQSADSLKQAFIQSGFEDATFDVSFAGSQMQFAEQSAAGHDSDGRARQGRKIYGEFAQESLTSIQESSDTFFDDDVSVNIVA